MLQPAAGQIVDGKKTGKPVVRRVVPTKVIKPKKNAVGAPQKPQEVGALPSMTATPSPTKVLGAPEVEELPISADKRQEISGDMGSKIPTSGDSHP